MCPPTVQIQCPVAVGGFSSGREGALRGGGWSCVPPVQGCKGQPTQRSCCYSRSLLHTRANVHTSYLGTNPRGRELRTGPGVLFAAGPPPWRTRFSLAELRAWRPRAGWAWVWAWA
ncbi:hypothetical protein LZ30DRAFT_732279 [Colletotrichum cereale]|nr:hypothetical protein LZ30DRAFT_732279 [Colletotrichum cereale]